MHICPPTIPGRMLCTLLACECCVCKQPYTYCNTLATISRQSDNSSAKQPLHQQQSPLVSRTAHANRSKVAHTHARNWTYSTLAMAKQGWHNQVSNMSWNRSNTAPADSIQAEELLRRAGKAMQRGEQLTRRQRPARSAASRRGWPGP